MMKRFEDWKFYCFLGLTTLRLTFPPENRNLDGCRSNQNNFPVFESNLMSALRSFISSSAERLIGPLISVSSCAAHAVCCFCSGFVGWWVGVRHRNPHLHFLQLGATSLAMLCHLSFPRPTCHLAQNLHLYVTHCGYLRTIFVAAHRLNFSLPAHDD